MEDRKGIWIHWMEQSENGCGRVEMKLEKVKQYGKRLWLSGKGMKRVGKEQKRTLQDGSAVGWDGTERKREG